MRKWLRKKTLTKYGYGNPIENWIALLLIILLLFFILKLTNVL